MDVAYNQHSPYSKHHASRSHTNLNHLTLAPLTSRLPLSDPDALPADGTSYSYIEGRSAPTTPSILSRSSSRVSMRRPHNIAIPKSKSSTNFLAAKQPRSAATTPGGTKLKKGVRDAEELRPFSELDRNDSDWLLRAGATLATSAREAKGQGWLASRASSTSLTAQKDEDDEDMEARNQARSRASRRGSTAGAFDADDEFSPVTTRRSFSFGPYTAASSRPVSRFPSRAGSRRGSRAQLFTPLSMEKEGYFDQKDGTKEDFHAEPDFVDIEEEGVENAEDTKNDEAIIQKLARASGSGIGGWVEKMLGWSLFAVEEDGEETETDTIDEKAEDWEISSRTPHPHVESIAGPEDAIPPPQDDDAGGWQDAAWLLSVATKVLL